jgi:hypothetical protein
MEKKTVDIVETKNPIPNISDKTFIPIVRERDPSEELPQQRPTQDPKPKLSKFKQQMLKNKQKKP